MNLLGVKELKTCNFGQPHKKYYMQGILAKKKKKLYYLLFRTFKLKIQDTRTL